MEKDAASSKERIQESTRDTQREVQNSGRQAVDDVSHLDPNRGTIVNTGHILMGEGGEIMDQLMENAKERGFGEGNKPNR